MVTDRARSLDPQGTGAEKMIVGSTQCHLVSAADNRYRESDPVRAPAAWLNRDGVSPTVTTSPAMKKSRRHRGGGVGMGHANGLGASASMGALPTRQLIVRHSLVSTLVAVVEAA